MRINNSQQALFAQNTYRRFSELSEKDLKSNYLLLNKAIVNDKELRAVINSGSLMIQGLSLRESESSNDENIEVADVLYAEPEYQSANLSEGEKGIIIDFLCLGIERVLTPEEQFETLKG